MRQRHDGSGESDVTQLVMPSRSSDWRGRLERQIGRERLDSLARRAPRQRQMAWTCARVRPGMRRDRSAPRIFRGELVERDRVRLTTRNAVDASKISHQGNLGFLSIKI
jgi:hypothetical protein